MDLNMIKMHGDEATKIVTYFIQIKQLVRENNYINSIIVGHSSDDNEETNQIFKNAGADHILPKPSKLNIVKELIESIFLT